MYTKTGCTSTSTAFVAKLRRITTAQSISSPSAVLDIDFRTTIDGNGER
jgi:hypothetical protein